MRTKAEIFEIKTLDAATNLILTKMEELRGDKVENKEMKRRRWIWELIQNANDCSANKQIDISISTNEKKIVFSHNGDSFTYENLVDLITQISTKVKDEKKVGKFGTGFIATHLLSDKVHIQGSYHESEDSDEYKELNILLDRSGKNAEEIRESIENAFSVLDSLENKSNININNFNMTTSFIYEIGDDILEVNEAVEKGFLDWERTIPFVMAFSDNIRSIRFNNIYVTKDPIIKEAKNISSVRVHFYKDDKPYKEKYVSINVGNKENVNVACILNNENGKWNFENLMNFPKLFCVFPLIGTENFPFPIVMNSKKFHVSQERNSIHEGVEENINIIIEALELYNQLIQHWINYDVNCFFYLCQISDDFGRSAFLETYKNKVKEIYQHADILYVITKDNELERRSLIKNDEKKTFIPFYDRDAKGFWELFRKFTKKSVPILEEIHFWRAICPENIITISDFIKAVEKNERVIKDIDRLGEKQYFEALNKLNELCFDVQKKCYIHKVYYLNQKFQFEEQSKLMIDENLDEELKDILIGLGKDMQVKLIHREIVVLNENEIEKYNNENITVEICAIIRRNLVQESGGRGRTSDEQAIYNKLTDWFINNNILAKQLFSDIYEKQHLLTQPEETIRRLKLANQVEDMLKKNNINFSVLNEIVNKSSQLLLMIQNEEADVSPELKELLEHISSSNPMSGEYFTRIMNRSIASVHAELVKNPSYIVEFELDLWRKNSLSSTVFIAGKAGREIHIIVRPSDNSKIIFHEDTEFEALDECESELWTDDGNGKVMMITLGDLIKTTGITKIPLKKII